MTDTRAGRVHHERTDHILKITIDNVAKKNAFDPYMMEQLSDALTVLEASEDLWAGVLCAAGNDFSAGLDMPKFFGPNAIRVERPADNVDPFGLANQCSKPIVTAVQGIVYTIGIEMMLAGDIVVSADDARFCQMECKRGIAPPGVQVTKPAGRHFIAAGEQAAIDAAAHGAKPCHGHGRRQGRYPVLH